MLGPQICGNNSLYFPKNKTLDFENRLFGGWLVALPKIYSIKKIIT